MKGVDSVGTGGALLPGEAGMLLHARGTVGYLLAARRNWLATTTPEERDLFWRPTPISLETKGA